SSEPGRSTVDVSVFLTFQGVLPSGLYVYTGRCEFEVVDPSAPTTTTTLPPGTFVYDVTSMVLASDFGGEGNVTNTEWTFTFACEDGRCDADVMAGALSFVAEYQPDGSFVFEDVDPSGGCTLTRAGVIEPTAWSDGGPTTFTARWTSVSECGSDPVVVEWESVAVRR
ncbi:MAG: hypothetical protein R3246_15205, partial [Acidimicrobiia bacterium]|nr:hypothetical protein [Acidimicrobiia bacterium]